MALFFAPVANVVLSSVAAGGGGPGVGCQQRDPRARRRVRRRGARLGLRALRRLHERRGVRRRHDAGRLRRRGGRRRRLARRVRHQAAAESGGTRARAGRLTGAVRPLDVAVCALSRGQTRSHDELSRVPGTVPGTRLFAHTRAVRYAALLRGINVGGKALIPMSDLRDCVTEVGHANVATYIASGNVIFEAPRRSAAALEAELERAIERRFELDVKVFVRTAAQLEAVAAAVPKGWIGNAKLRCNGVFLAREDRPPVARRGARAEGRHRGGRLRQGHAPLGGEGDEPDEVVDGQALAATRVQADDRAQPEHDAEAARPGRGQAVLVELRAPRCDPDRGGDQREHDERAAQRRQLRDAADERGADEQPEVAERRHRRDRARAAPAACAEHDWRVQRDAGAAEREPDQRDRRARRGRRQQTAAGREQPAAASSVRSPSRVPCP